MTEREFKLKTYRKRLANLHTFRGIAKDESTRKDIEAWIADTTRLINELEAAA